jgi:hypothetical protein
LEQHAHGDRDRAKEDQHHRHAEDGAIADENHKRRKAGDDPAMGEADGHPFDEGHAAERRQNG